MAVIPPADTAAVGDVEALAKAVYDTGLVNLPLADSLDVDCHDVARAVLATNPLDATYARALRDASAVAEQAVGTTSPADH